jgi:hypothetical protein
MPRPAPPTWEDLLAAEPRLARLEEVASQPAECATDAELGRIIPALERLVGWHRTAADGHAHRFNLASFEPMIGRIPKANDPPEGGGQFCRCGAARSVLEEDAWLRTSAAFEVALGHLEQLQPECAHDGLCGVGGADDVDDLADDARFAWSEDTARLVAGGTVPEPELLIAGDPLWLMGHAHALIGESGDGKSFLATALGARSGGVWAYLDEENGPIITADRLVTMGADASRLRHLPFGQPALREAVELRSFIESASPRMVIFDSGVDHYRASSIDENDNTAVTAWQLAFPQPIARGIGACVLTLDAIPKDGSGTQRGASAKRYKVDRELRIRKMAEFGRELVGEIEVEVRKDRTGLLPVGYRQRYRIGGRPFVFERVETISPETVAERRENALEVLRRNVRSALLKNGATDLDHGVSLNKLRQLTSGSNALIDQAARVEADDPTSPVHSAVGARRSVLFWINTDEDRDDLATSPSHSNGSDGEVDGEVASTSPRIRSARSRRGAARSAKSGVTRERTDGARPRGQSRQGTTDG